MPERFEICIVYKKRYINTLPFLSFYYSATLTCLIWSLFLATRWRHYTIILPVLQYLRVVACDFWLFQVRTLSCCGVDDVSRPSMSAIWHGEGDQGDVHVLSPGLERSGGRRRVSSDVVRRGEAALWIGRGRRWWRRVADGRTQLRPTFDRLGTGLRAALPVPSVGRKHVWKERHWRRIRRGHCERGGGRLRRILGDELRLTRCVPGL